MDITSSKFLLEKGYIIHGIIRRSSSINTERIDSLIAEYKNEKVIQFILF